MSLEVNSHFQAKSFPRLFLLQLEGSGSQTKQTHDSLPSLHFCCAFSFHLNKKRVLVITNISTDFQLGEGEANLSSVTGGWD